jgi:hypothetical protein
MAKLNDITNLNNFSKKPDLNIDLKSFKFVA